MESQETEDKTDQPNADTDVVSFGDYITYEYSILKTVFSYLSAKHLKICRKVCREWKEMANKMPNCYSVECYSGKNDEWPEFNKYMNPALIFYFDKYFNNKTDGLKSLIERHYDITNVPFHHVLAANAIYTPCSRGQTFPILGPESNSSRTLVFIPQIPGLTVKQYEFDKTRAVLAEEVEPLLSAKGVLLMSQSSSTCVHTANRVIHYLYFTTSKKKEVRAERPCLAGGLLAKCAKFAPKKFVLTPVVALTLEGDNVTVHCDIHKTVDHDGFFRRLSLNAGPVPENAVRFAFVFNCVGRIDEVAEEKDQIELVKFREYFPNVPYFGFWSYGEFCIPDSHARNMTDPKKIKIDRHIRYLNSACASYMIVTVQH